MYKIVQSTKQPNAFFVVRTKDEICLANYHEMAVLRAYVNEVATWCKEAFGNEYETWDIDCSGSTFIFEKDEDAMAFKMRWVW